MAEPTLADVQQAIAAKSQPSLADVRAAIEAKSQSPSLGQKALGYLSTGAKALDSVTGAPTRAAIYAMQNNESPLMAAKSQFANMTDEAPSGADIATKAGFSTEKSAPYIAPGPGNIPANQLPQPRFSAADVAGVGIDLAANPLNFVGPVARGAGKVVEGLASLSDATSLASKPTAKAISAAAERLGFSATPGMLSDSHVVQGLESSLSQSPSIPGALTRRAIKPVAKGLEKAAEDLVSVEPDAASSAYKAGDSASKGIVSNVGEKISNIKMSYEPFNKELPKMIPDAESKWKLADQIAKIGDQHLDPNEVEGVVKGTTNRVMNSESLADIEETRKRLGKRITKAFSDNDHELADTLTRIKDKLSDFRDTQFQTLAEKAFPGPEGAKIGQQMVEEYKNAMGQHAALMNDLKEVGPLFGIKAKNPKDFIEAFSEIPPEQVAKKLFQTNNYQALQKVQQYFPEEFQTIRASKLQELRASSLENPIDPQNSAVSPTKLISKINKLTPEVRTVLFGDKAGKVSDMQTVMGAFPEKIGPSGTPKGEMFTHMADPLQQAADVAKYGAYRVLGSAKGASAVSKVNPEALSRALSKLPNASGPGISMLDRSIPATIDSIPRAAGTPSTPAPMPSLPNPKDNSNPNKGPNKWANDGLQKLKQHVSPDDKAMLDKYKGAMMVDPQAKQLLVTASNYSPGSKPLDDILKHLKKKYEGKN